MLELCLPIITAQPLNTLIPLPLKLVSEGRCDQMEMPLSYFIHLNPMVWCSLQIHEELNASSSILEFCAV